MQEKTIKERIDELYDSLSPACRKVAKYVNDNYQNCLLLSSSELAKAAKVSHTAVIRYTRALGFSGFLEYKKALKDEYIPKQKVYSYLNKMQAGDDGGYLLRRFYGLFPGFALGHGCQFLYLLPDIFQGTAVFLKAPQQAGLFLYILQSALAPADIVPYPLTGYAALFGDLGQGQVFIIMEIHAQPLSFSQKLAVKIQQHGLSQSAVAHGHAPCQVFTVDRVYYVSVSLSRLFSLQSRFLFPARFP